MTDILNQIDATLADVSSCAFCRTRLDDSGPSGDFCGEICQQNWTAQRLRGKSGIEKGSVPAGTVVEMRARVEFDGSAPTCRGCRRPALERPVERDNLCCFCLAAPRCGNERTNALNGRIMTCIRPLGHEPPCEEGHPAGSQWVADTSPRWPIRSDLPKPVGRGTVDVAEAMDEAAQLEPTYRRYECPHPGCGWIRVALDLDVFDGLLAEHERTEHATPSVEPQSRGWVRLREMFRRDR